MESKFYYFDQDSIDNLAAILHEAYVRSVGCVTYLGEKMSTYEDYKKNEKFTKQCKAWKDVAIEAIISLKEPLILSHRKDESEEFTKKLLDNIKVDS